MARRCSTFSPTHFSRRCCSLGAGWVIHAMHHEQDMRYYGGFAETYPADFLGDDGRNAGDYRCWRCRHIRFCRFLLQGRDHRELPLPAASTYGHMLLCHWRCRCLADQFLQLAADVPDLLRQSRAGRESSISNMPSMTITIMARTSRPSRGHETAHGDGTAGYHPHESPLADACAAWVLDRWRGVRRLCRSTAALSMPKQAPHSGTAASHFNEHLMHEMHEVPLLGEVVGDDCDADRPCDRLCWPISALRDARRRSRPCSRPLYRFFLNKWYFDELYDPVFVRPAFCVRPPVLEAGRHGHRSIALARMALPRWSTSAAA